MFEPLSRRTLRSAFVPLVAALAPLAAAQAPDLDALEAAIEERVIELQSLPAPTPELLKEFNNLSEALESLGVYGGVFASYAAVEDTLSLGWRRDLIAITNTAQAVHDSETQEADILFHLDVIRDLLLEFGAAARQDALGSIVVLVDESVGIQIESLVLLGDDATQVGQWWWRRLDYGKGAKFLGQGVGYYLDGVFIADEQKEDEAQELGVDPEPLEVVLPDEDPVAFEPYSVEAKINLPTPTPLLTLSVRAMAESPPPSSGAEGTTPVEVDAIQATVGFETLLDVPAGELTCPIPIEIMPFADEVQMDRSELGSDFEGFEGQFKYGDDVDVSGNTAVVGAPCNGSCPQGFDHRVFVHERLAGGFDGWALTAELYPYDSPGMASGFADFGTSVAISGDTIVVGAPGDNTCSTSCGAAFVYERTPEGWQFVALLEDPDPEPSGPYGSLFGAAVDICGDRIVVGAPDAEQDAGLFFPDFDGAAFVFERSAVDGSWNLAADLYSDAFQQVLGGAFGVNGEIGSDVAIDGDMIVVKAWVTEGSAEPGTNATARFYAYRAVDGAWLPENATATSLQVYSSDTSDPEIGRVAVDEASGTIALGMPTVGFPGAPDQGRVYLYRDSNPIGKPLLSHVATLTAPGPTTGDRFGSAVAFDGSTVVVGSPGHDHPYDGPANAGSIYIFVEGHEPGCPPIADPSGWGLIARRVASSPQADAGFGSSVAAEEDIYFVTDDSGSAEVNGLEVFTGMSPMQSGTYQLLVQVDPHDQVTEVSELGGLSEEDELADNVIASQNELGETVSVDFCIPALDQPNLSVVSLELVPEESNGDGYVIFDQDGTQLTKAGLNVVVRMTGSFEGPLSGSRLSADMLGGPSPGAITIWNDAAKAYQSSIQLPTMYTGDEVSISLDVRFPGTAAGGGLPANYEVGVRATVSAPPKINEIDPSDDSLTINGQNYTQIEIVSCDFAQEYETKMGNDDFNIGIDISASLALAADLDEIPGHDLFEGPSGPFGITNQAEMGAIGSVSGGVPFTFFGEDLGDLTRVRALAERDPTFQTPGFEEPGYGFIGADLQFLNITDPGGPLDVVMAWGPYDSTVYDPGQVFPDGFSLTPDGGFKLSLDKFTVEKEKKKKKTFFPGGFPVTVEAGAKGVLGVDVNLTVANAVTFNVAPFVDFGVSLAFSLGECSVLCVGAEGQLTLINDTFTISSGLGMVVKEEVDIGGDFNQAICAIACFTVDNKLSMLGGKLVAFAVTPWVDWCWVEVELLFTSFWIPYPCKFYLKKFEWEIISWDGLVYENILVDESEPACSVQVVGFVSCDDIPGSQVCGGN